MSIVPSGNTSTSIERSTRNGSRSVSNQPSSASIWRPCSASWSAVMPCAIVERLGVVGDRDVGPADGSRRRDHLLERQGAVAERRVHLEVAAGLRLPPGVVRERAPDLGGGEEPASRLLRLRHRRGLLEPSRDPLGDPGPDGAELGQRPAGLDELARLLGPEPGRAGGALERRPAMVRLLTRGVPQQLAEVPVGQRCRRHQAPRSSRSSGDRNRAIDAHVAEPRLEALALLS